MRSLRSSKCLKTTVELTFTIQKTSACSPWTACSVFNWKYQFSWVNLVQKLKFISLNWNFVPRLIKICRISWWCSLFLFSTANTFLGKFGPKNQICQFELKFRTRLLWIYAELCRKYAVVTFSFLDQKNPFWANLVEKIQIVTLSGILVPRLIRICGIQWYCSLFLFLIINIFLSWVKLRLQLY